MSYEAKLEHFRATFEKQHNERLAQMFPTGLVSGYSSGLALKSDTVRVEAGYKFDKVFIVRNDGQTFGSFMVESRTDIIYGIKSWTQVNRRRQYGSLDTVNDYDWSGWSLVDLAVPKPGTQAYTDFYVREQGIKAKHKKRGRRPNSKKQLVLAVKK